MSMFLAYAGNIGVASDLSNAVKNIEHVIRLSKYMPGLDGYPLPFIPG